MKTIYRKCIITRQLLDRQTMFRIVKTPNHEIKIDLTYKIQGRGAYLSKDKSIILKAQKSRALEKHLKSADCQNIYAELLALLI